jgi:hypothetical protein
MNERHFVLFTLSPSFEKTVQGLHTQHTHNTEHSTKSIKNMLHAVELCALLQDVILVTIGPVSTYLAIIRCKAPLP